MSYVRWFQEIKATEVDRPDSVSLPNVIETSSKRPVCARISGES
jgi:hypothetical protein